jgi:polyvinyl alcohol dehydrogenase (cytochrome)
VYVTTGNNYSVPTDPAYTACIANGGTSETCNSPADHFDSVLALNATTGAINWADRFASSDDWNVACIQAPGIDPDNCPKGAGPDYDFGSGVQLMTIQTSSGPKTVIGAGQKSGIYSELDPTTGQLLWATQVGPGSSLGGMEWGSAADGKRIYVQIANVGFQPYSNPALGNAGSYAALDEVSGKILWQVPDPGSWIDLGPMTVGNGVVYASSMSYFGTPTMLALDAATGATLWGFNPGSSVNAGASLAQNMVFWGSGYSNLGTGLGTPNNKFFAFSLDGK